MQFLLQNRPGRAHHYGVESFVPTRISVRRGGAEVPLMPGAQNVISSSVWPKLIGERHRVGDLEIPEHEHETFCMHLQISGNAGLEWWCSGRNGLEAPTPGALILLPPGTRDRLRWEGSSERIVVSLDSSVVQEVAQQIKPALNPRFCVRWHFRDEAMQHLLAEIGRESEAGWPLGALYADLLGLALSNLLLTRHTNSPVTLPICSGGMSTRCLKSTLEYVSDNLHKDLRLGEIAAISGLSPFHFARLFRKTTGATPHQYHLAQRIRKAKEYLRFSLRPVAEIGIEVGFQNAAHFTRTFRSREGMTPTEWRAEIWR